MDQSDIENRLDINTGKEWSAMDIFDLTNMLLRGESIPEIASFLCRSRREVREKVAELARACHASQDAAC